GGQRREAGPELAREAIAQRVEVRLLVGVRRGRHVVARANAGQERALRGLQGVAPRSERGTGLRRIGRGLDDLDRELAEELRVHASRLNDRETELGEAADAIAALLDLLDVGLL